MAFGSSDVNMTRYDFNLTKGEKATAYVDWEAQKIEIESGGKRMALPDISEDMMDYKSFISESISFEDFNFDGYTDIGVTVGIGYGGLNVFVDYYFYDPKQAQYRKYMKNICNLDIKENTKILASHMKSGQEYAHEYYQINVGGRPFLFLLGTSLWTDDKEDDLKTNWTAKNVRVKSERAYFYDNWDGEKLKTYIIKGERVMVLDLESTKGVYWVKIAYKGKNQTFKQWVKLSNLVFDEIVIKESKNNEN